MAFNARVHTYTCEGCKQASTTTNKNQLYCAEPACQRAKMDRANAISRARFAKKQAAKLKARAAANV